ncbi:MAG: hypothetical protein IJP20_01730 [Clostridia bacterium]|nr:hypothetical protein [Clostridia bacterium]
MKINEKKRKELTRKVMTRMVMPRKEKPRKVKLLILTIMAVVEIALMIGFIVLLAINVSKTNFGVSNWIWVHWEYIFGIVYPMLFYITDLSSIHNEALSDETKRKWRVKDNSFLRKIIPIKEGKVLIDEVHWKYRYVLYPRVLPVFIQSIIIILGLIVLAIHFVFVPFIPDLVFFIIGITSIFTSLIHTGLMMTATHLNL